MKRRWAEVVAPLAVALALDGWVPRASATVGCTHSSPSTILEQSRDAAQFVFIARVTALTWYDKFEGRPPEGPEYPVGVVKATFVLQDSIKGGVPPFSTINQTVYGHGDRSTLRVATDYIFMMNSGELIDRWGSRCLLGLQEIPWYGAAEGWSERIRSAHPDQTGGSR